MAGWQRHNSVKRWRWRWRDMLTVAVPKVIAGRKMIGDGVQRYVCKMPTHRQVGSNMRCRRGTVLRQRRQVVGTLAPTERRRTIHIVRRHATEPATGLLSIPTHQHRQRRVVVGTLTDSTRQRRRAEVGGLATGWRLPRQWMILKALGRINSVRWDQPAISMQTNTTSLTGSR